MATTAASKSEWEAASREAVVYSPGTPEWKILTGELADPTPRKYRATAQHPAASEILKKVIEKAGMRVPTFTPPSFFRYSKLKKGEIRILRLYPSKHPNDPLKADLFKRELDEVDGKYEALSYCWGTKTMDQETIRIRDLNAMGPAARDIRQKSKAGQGALLTGRLVDDFGAIMHTDFTIGKNLFDALIQLRSKYNDVYLWVDAICIDQSQHGAEEKQDQLVMMPRIYNLAFSVCVWLGADKGVARSAFHLVSDIINCKNLDDMICDPERMASWGHLTELMRADWFGRRWIIQEIALSREASIHCGEHSVHWDDFADAVSLVVEKVELMRIGYRAEVFDDIEISSASILIQTLGNICQKSDHNEKRDSLNTRLLNMETLVSTLLTFQASFPRDTIYSILFLAKDTPQVNEGWQDLHRDQLRRVRDCKLKRLADVTRTLSDKQNLLEKEIRETLEFYNLVESQIGKVEEMRRDLLEAISNNRETDARQIARCIDSREREEMSEEELRFHHGVLKQLQDRVNQFRLKIRHLNLKSERTEKEVEDQPITLLPNYKVSERDLFIAFITRSIHRSGSLDIICRHWAPELKPIPGDNLGSQMPSWISSRSRASFGLPGRARGRQNGENFVSYLAHDQRRRYSVSGDTEANIYMLPDPILTDGEEMDTSFPAPDPGFSMGLQASSRAADGIVNGSELSSSEARVLPEEPGRTGHTAPPLVRLTGNAMGKLGQGVLKTHRQPASLWSGRSESPTAGMESSKHGFLGWMSSRVSRPKETRIQEASEVASVSEPVKTPPDEEYGRFTEIPQPQDRFSVEPDPATLNEPTPDAAKPAAPTTTTRAMGGAKKRQSVAANLPSSSSWASGPHRLSGILVATGFVLGRIHSQSDVMRGGVIPSEWVSRLGWKRARGSGNQVPDTLWRLLVADRMSNGARPPLWYKRACLQGLVNVRVSDNAGNIHSITHADRKISELTSMYFRRVESVVWNRRILELRPERPIQGQDTDEDAGHEENNESKGSESERRILYGLGPEGSKVNDVVCVLYGCSVPVILRLAKEQRVERLFEVVGEAYVHGIMDGEFMVKDWTNKEQEFRLG